MFSQETQGGTQMAQPKQDLFTKLADRGEQMVGRITELPGAKQFLDTTTSLGKRLDEMQRRLRALDPLEKRVTKLEARLAKLEGKGGSSSSRSRSTSSRTKAKP